MSRILLENFFGCVLDHEQAGIGQFEQEHGFVFGLGRNPELQFDFEALGIKAARLQIHAQVDLRSCRHARRRARILEGQVLHILSDDLNAKLWPLRSTRLISIRPDTRIAHEQDHPGKARGATMEAAG